MTDWITRLIEQMGYFGIALLMFLENVFPPLPSEVIMPLAGYLSARGEAPFWTLTASEGADLVGAAVADEDELDVVLEPAPRRASRGPLPGAPRRLLLDRRPGLGQRLPAHGRPISIVDVSGVPSDITSVVVSVLARMVFDYAIWSRTEAQRPLLLVCEEAHRYVPKDDNGRGQAVRRILERIAKEGRKYGVSLGLITQRPSDLAEGVLSQCGTIVAIGPMST